MATRNYRGTQQVHFVAESAIAEAVQLVNGPGVVSFQNDVVSGWAARYGAGRRSFAPLAGFTYQVTPLTDPTNAANAGRLRADATGPEGTRSVMVASLVRSGTASPPGAVYLANDNPTNAVFNGNSFAIDGNDHNYTGGAGPQPPIPGISTRNDANTQETANSLSPGQANNVQGQGYSAGPPTVPSVLTSPAAPSIVQMNAFIDDLLSRPRPPDVTLPNLVGNPTYGTPAAPQITHFTGLGSLGLLTVNGNVKGAGIMIVEGDLLVLGNLEFDGLVLVRGQFILDALPVFDALGGVVNIGGSALVYGSLWTQKLTFKAQGNGQVLYSSQAMNLANAVGGGAALPSPMRVTSLADCAETAPGTGGC